MSGRNTTPPIHSAAEEDIADKINEAGRVLELTDPDDGLGRTDRIINKSVEAIGISMLAAVFLIIFLNAFLRYFANISLLWAEEVVLALVPWLAMLGLFLSVRRGQMVTVDVISRYVSPRTFAWLGVASHIICIGAFLYLAIASWQYNGLVGGYLTPYLQIPRGLSLSSLTIGAIIVSLAFTAKLVRDVIVLRRAAQ